jgi:hypothetical protein
MSIAGIISGYNSKKALEAIVVQEIRHNAGNIAHSLDQEIDRVVRQARSWSIIDMVAEGLENNDNKLVQDFLTPIVSIMGIFSSVVVTRTDGRVFAYNEKNLRGEIISPEMIKEINFQSEPWFGFFEKHDTAGMFVGDLGLDPLDRIENEPQLANEITVPVFDFTGERIGFFNAHYPVSKITAILNDFIVRGEGGRITGFPVLNTERGLALLPSQLEKWAGIQAVKGRRGEGTLVIDKEPYLFYTSESKGYAANPGFGWTVTFYVKRELALRPVINCGIACLSPPPP